MAIYDKTNKILYLPSGGGKAIYDEEKIEEAYQSGYTAGYDSGWTDAGEECGKRDYSKEYFTIEMLEDGAISPNYAIDYRINGGVWTNYPGDNSNIAVNAGDTVEFRSNSPFLVDFFGYKPICGSCITYGNIMSLTYGDDFKGKTGMQVCGRFFYTCNTLVDASGLVLPSVDGSYGSMFEGCTSLTTAPELPATALTFGCYESMFRDCTSLTTAPELPATILTQGCYNSMFEGCTSLTTAPELPATTLTKNCYTDMFSGCTSLTTAPVLPATILAENCYLDMFQGCTSLTTAPSILPATTLARWCYGSMFEGCTSLTTAPELPATILVDYCYRSMFENCTSLKRVTCRATDISADVCTLTWLNRVASTGTFVKAHNVEWPTGFNGIPSGWTVIEE